MERLYREEGAESAVDKGLWHEILRIINEGTVEGLSQAAAPPAHDELFCRELRHSNEVFAASRRTPWRTKWQRNSMMPAAT